MLCPNCKKQETSSDIIKQDKKTNVVLRNRYCSKCDFSFSTHEKIKIIKKRKPRPDKLFMNYRFYLYGCFRIIALKDTHLRLNKSLGGEYKINKKFNEIEFGFVNKAGKSGVYYADKKIKDREKVSQLMAEGKKQTIENVIAGVYYWKYRNHLMKNDQISDDEIEILTSRLAELGLKQWKKSSKSDEENKLCNKALDELEHFHKSVSMYIKNKEYNQNFFINYRVENEFHPWNSKELKFLSEYWKEEISWQFYFYAR